MPTVATGVEKIAYSDGFYDWNDEIYWNDEIFSMNPNGTGAVWLGPHNHEFPDGDPAWSPDGSMIVFVYADMASDTIRIMKSGGASPGILLTYIEGDEPVWSPDGGRIAFRAENDHEGNEEGLTLMNVDGSGRIRLADGRQPAWSPDGSQIAFTSWQDGNGEIYVMNADGTGQTRVTTNPALDQHPAYSPDGSRIAFVSDRDGNNEIYVMDTDGTGQTRLTYDPFADGSPSWSPDGSQIVFDKQETSGYGIYVMSASGFGPTRIASGNDPAWGTIIPGSALPRASFVSSPAAPVPLDTITYIDGSYDTNGTITSWSWEFGDGGTSTIRNPEHAYATTGTYLVSLTVTDNDGFRASTAQSVTVSPSNLPPVVTAGDDLRTSAGSPVTFSGSYTDTGDTGTHTIAWTFGDGGTASGSLTPSHTYADPGIYTATLTVTDALGESGSDSLTVSVSTANVPPIASFMANATSGIAPLTVRFTDTSANIPTSWAWTFGDGGTSSIRHPVHTYAAVGVYTVNLTVRNTGGVDDERKVGYINVTSLPTGVVMVPGGSGIPTDTNADGTYDDVNGNQRRDFADVVLYFNQMTWIAANEPMSAFDCNGNDRIDFADVVWLFNNL